MRCPVCNKIISWTSYGIASHYRYNHPDAACPNTTVPLSRNRYDEAELFLISGTMNREAARRKRKARRFAIPGL